MNLTLTTLSSSSVLSELDVRVEAEELNKEIQDFLLKEAPKDAEQSLSKTMKAYLQQAKVIRHKITFLKRDIDMLLKKGSGQDSNLLLQKNYSLLAIALREGYSFVMNMRKQITKEKIGYAIRITDGKEESLGIYSMEKMLNMSSLVQNANGSFVLALRNVEEINKAAKEQNEVNQELADTLKKVLSNYKTIFSNVVQKRYQARKEAAAALGIDTSMITIGNKKLVDHFSQETLKQLPEVYRRGMGGFILERAFSAFATGENVNSIVDYFTDFDRYSSGGDLQGKEVPQEIKKYYDNLEVKNITATGASLVQLNTVLKDLNKIIEILSSGKKNIKEQLKIEIFKNKNRLKVDKTLAKELRKVDERIFAALSGKGRTF